jgi:hypothetical protein
MTNKANKQKSRRASTGGNLTASGASPGYSTKIIKAGALLPDTRTLLENWDSSCPPRENLERFRAENIFGKASRSRVQDILAIFRQRYLANREVAAALSILAKGRLNSVALDRVLYFHSAHSDRLLYDTVVNFLLPQRKNGIMDVSPSRLEAALIRWVEEGKTTSEWSEPTTRRVMQGLLSTLRDFGVLEGAVNKRLAAVYLPVEAFAYIAFYMKQDQPSGKELIRHPDWQLFFLPPEGVERFMAEAHQRNLLEWHAAGSVTRLTFPADNLEGYARVLVERAY